MLPEKEPFALMARDTKKRIRSTAALTSPMTEEVEAIRAEVVRPLLVLIQTFVACPDVSTQTPQQPITERLLFAALN